MSEIKRIIPKLEIKNDKLIKGIQFEGLRVIGDPVDYSKKFFKETADQLIIIDIVASLYSRENLFSIINNITNDIFIPVTAGGGIRSINDITKLLDAGADRICINTFALENINILDQISNIFGSQFISIMIEAKKIGNKYYCMKNHGRDNSGLELDKWINLLNKKNIGEIIIQSIDCDGMMNGFDKDIIAIVKKSNIKTPVVLGSGIGSYQDCLDVLENNFVSGLTISSALYSQAIKIKELKKELKVKGVPINEI